MGYIGRAATNAGSVNYLDDISSGFDGSDTTFTCAVKGTTITPGQENVYIYLDGVFQHPSDAYSISGSTITFTEAPVSGTDFTAYVAGEGAYLDDGTVSTAKLDDDAVTASKLDDDGTGFQVGDLGVGGSLTSGDKLTVTGRLRASGGIIGDITGDVTGNVTGNASGTAATVTGGTQASITSAANLATVGTIGTGVWNGTAIASAYLDADTAHLSGTQTFSGAKTFTANPIIQSDTGTLNFYNASGAQRAFLQLSSTGLIIDTDSFLEFKPNNTRALYIDSSLDSTFAGTVTVGASNGSEEVKANRTRVRHIDGLADASDYSHGDLYINHISSGNIICSSNVGVGHTTPQFGLTLAQGDTDATAIGWEDASNTKRASIYTATSDDFLTFNVAGGDRMKLGSNASNWTLQLTGNSPYGLQITTTASNSSSHDMFKVKRGDGTTCIETWGDGNTKIEKEIQSKGGLRTYATNGGNPAGDFYNIAHKFATYRQTLTSSHITDGYVNFSSSIYRDNVIGVIANYFGYGSGTNTNYMGYQSAYVPRADVYASGTLRAYLGSSATAGDYVYLTVIYHGNTG